MKNQEGLCSGRTFYTFTHFVKNLQNIKENPLKKFLYNFQNSEYQVLQTFKNSRL